MKECDKLKSKFERALYNELTSGEQEAFAKHLNECEECSNEFEELKKTLVLLQSYRREEPSEEFMSNFWKELNPKLTKQTQLSVWWDDIKSVFGSKVKLSHQIAAGFTILILGVIIGKFLLSGNDVITQPNNNGNSQIAVQARAERYIDRSKVLLLGIMNFDPEADDLETISLSHQQTISKELISEAADLKDELKKPNNRQLKELVSDIEVILMQIANLEEQQDIEGIDLIKDGVDKKGIFLKINIQEIKKSSDAINPDVVKSNKKENNT